MAFLHDTRLKSLLVTVITAFILILVASLLFSWLIKVLIKPLPESETETSEEVTEATGTQMFPRVGFIWCAWYFIAFFLPLAVIPYPSWSSSPTYGVSESFSMCLLLIGAYFLGRSDARPGTGFIYGAGGVFLIMPYFFDIQERGLWFQPEFRVQIFYQWVGLSMLLGAISAGIVVSVARRRDTINKSEEAV